MIDWLDTGRLIAARLRDQIPGLVDVQETVSVAAIEELTPAVPAALVIWDGDDTVDTAGRGLMQSIHQRWLVVLAVRSAAGTSTGEGIVREAGPLLPKIMRALGGWEPSPDHDPLTRITSSLKPGFLAGYGYYPIAYTARVFAGEE